MMKVCIVGASGKPGQDMVQHALDRGYQVAGVCRERSVEKLDAVRVGNGPGRSRLRAS
jgi:putative NADH-flavin reductase